MYAIRSYYATIGRLRSKRVTRCRFRSSMRFRGNGRRLFDCPQKKLRRVKPTYPIFDPQQCNEVWSADYKGKFLMGNKKYCHTLTIADSRSRYLFTAKANYKEDYKSAQSEFRNNFV